jgi:hypothetical protein
VNDRQLRTLFIRSSSHGLAKRGSCPARLSYVRVRVGVGEEPQNSAASIGA